MTAAPVPQALQDQITQEVDDTLKLLDKTRQAARHEVPPWLWLRAARGCWLTANLDWARDFYRRAAPALAAYALDTGRRVGTMGQYAHLAVGAAWMSTSHDVLADVGRQLDAVAEHQIGSLENPPEALIRVSLLLTRIRIAWYRGQMTVMKEMETELERRVNALDAWSKSFWLGERGGASHAFIRSVIQGAKPDAVRPALQELDRRLQGQRAHPPTIADLVDEEFISFAAAMNDRAIPLPPISTPIVPGLGV